MRKKWRELSLFQRVLLVILAAMILGFGIATPMVSAQKGIEYRNTLLYAAREGEVRRYAGRVDGKRTEFTVTPEGTVEYHWGEEVYGPYRVVEDPAAAPETRMTGLEIRQDGQVLFRGGLRGGEWPMLYGEDGEPFEFLEITYGTSSGKIYRNGKELTPRDLHEPGLSTVANLALGEPELTHRGNFGLYLLVTLLPVMDILGICFWKCLFYHRMSLTVRDPDAAEPSDYYLSVQRAGWIILAVGSAVCYWMVLTAIN